MRSALPEPIDRPDYTKRLNENVAWLLERRGLSRKRAAAMADLAPATLRNWLGGTADPSLSKLDALAEVCGLEEAYELLLPLSELKGRYGQDGEALLPFVLSLSSSSQQSQDSGALSRSLPQFGGNAPKPKKRRGSGRTGTEGASSRCLMHNTVAPASLEPDSEKCVVASFVPRTPRPTSNVA